MKPSVSFIAANILCACMSTSQPANAEESPGVCNIKPRDFLATFGYAASGQALAGNPLGIPVGAFTHVGTATGKTASQNGNSGDNGNNGNNGNNIVGTWSMTFEQNDSSGHVNTFTFPGTFTVSTTNCTGNFSWNNVKVGPVFHAVFVNHADEFRAISTVPGVISSAMSGKKL